MKTITVKGVGTVSEKPDYIVLSLGVRSKAKTCGECVGNANERIELLESAAQSAGFEKGELKTTSFNVQSDYENYRNDDGSFGQRLAGYICRYDLKLAFDFDSERLSRTLDIITGCGADAELSIEFTLKHPEKASAALLKSAADNARAKAEVLCAASGVTLGELVNIEYNWSDVRFGSAEMWRCADAVPMAAAAPEFTPDDIKSSDTATFIWEIK